MRNPGVTPGYYGLPEVNAKRLKDGWLATGDLFYRDDDGFLYFKGRTDDMFNSGGENIYPKEVENLLLSHPEVYDAAVVPVAHPVKGHVPVAMVMRQPGSAVTEAELKQYCLDQRPGLCPSAAHPPGRGDAALGRRQDRPHAGAARSSRAAFGRELAQAS